MNIEEDSELLMRVMRRDCSFDELVMYCIESQEPAAVVCEAHGWTLEDLAFEYSCTGV